MTVTQIPHLQVAQQPLALPPREFQVLLKLLGPSLGLWRAAEVAVLREQSFPGPILDLGCGDGIVTSQVISTVHIGVDPDRQALAKAARQRIYRQLIPTSIEQAELPAGSIGTVVSNSVLEHLPQVDTVLATVARLLRPGGKFIFTTPTESFGEWLALPSARYAAWRNRQLLHLNLWSLPRWEEHLKRAGLALTAARYYLRRHWVWFWDALELLQMAHFGRQRVVGLLWKQLPIQWLDRLAQSASSLDLGADEKGGGRLIVAQKT